MKNENFETMMNYMHGLLPKQLGETIETAIRSDIRLTIVNYNNKLIDEFCEAHNICRVCITGGFNCDSDHK